MTAPALDVGAVARFLRGAGVTPAGELTAELLPGGRSNLTYKLSDGERSFVLRRPPHTGATPSAHDMGREFRVTSALHAAGYPVAEPVGLCTDPAVLGAEFSVVGYVGGVVVRDADDLAAYGDAELARCNASTVRQLARLHALPYAEIGLSTLGRPEGYLARQVRRWSGQWERVATRESADSDRLAAALSSRVPPESGHALVHGDYRIDNLIVDAADPGTVLAVVDWEMATIGDPLSDVALMMAYRHEAFDLILGRKSASSSPRMPDEAAIAHAYATESGRDLPELSFHRALAYYKLAVIAEGIHARYRQGATVGPGFDTAGESVPVLLAAGLETLKEGSS